MQFNPVAVLLLIGGVIAVIIGVRGSQSSSLKAITGSAKPGTPGVDPASFFDPGVLGSPGSPTGSQGLGPSTVA